MAIIVDSYSETYQSQANSIHESVPFQGQSFTGDGGTLHSVKFYICKFGSPTGNMYAKIYSHSGTFGTSSIVDTLLATSGGVDVSTLSVFSTFSLVTFSFSGDQKITLENGTKYCVEANYDGGSMEFHYVAIGVDHADYVHAGNPNRYYLGGWHAETFYDLCFYVYKDDISSPFPIFLPT